MDVSTPASVCAQQGLKNVAFIMDMEGFHIMKRFYPREMSIAFMDGTCLKRYSVHTGMSFTDLAERDKRTVKYQTERIHGLRLNPQGNEAECCISIARMKETIVQLYNKVRSAEKYLVGYKGGQYERDILNELNIPSVNLELYGCPRYDILCHSYTPLPGCGYHVFCHPFVQSHCSRSEVDMFRLWALNAICSMDD